MCKKYPEVLVPGCVKDAKMMPKVVSTGRYKSSIVVPSCGSHKTLFPDKSVSARIPTPPPDPTNWPPGAYTGPSKGKGGSLADKEKLEGVWGAAASLSKKSLNLAELCCYFLQKGFDSRWVLSGLGKQVLSRASFTLRSCSCNSQLPVLSVLSQHVLQLFICATSRLVPHFICLKLFLVCGSTDGLFSETH